jgi:hypothetical protein
VLSDEVTCDWMKRTSKEAAQNQVAKRPSSSILYQGVVEGELCDDVEEMNLGKRQLIDEHGSERVEEDLEGAEEGLARNRVEENGFKGSGQVRIETIDTQRLVVSQVVWPE